MNAKWNNTNPDELKELKERINDINFYTDSGILASSILEEFEMVSISNILQLVNKSNQIFTTNANNMETLRNTAKNKEVSDSASNTVKYIMTINEIYTTVSGNVNPDGLENLIKACKYCMASYIQTILMYITLECNETFEKVKKLKKTNVNDKEFMELTEDTIELVNELKEVAEDLRISEKYNNTDIVKVLKKEFIYDIDGIEYSDESGSTYDELNEQIQEKNDRMEDELNEADTSDYIGIDEIDEL